jgi:hypothetical protein
VLVERATVSTRKCSDLRRKRSKSHAWPYMIAIGTGRIGALSRSVPSISFPQGVGRKDCLFRCARGALSGFPGCQYVAPPNFCCSGDALWLPNTERPEWLDGSLPGDRGFDPLGLSKPAEYLQVEVGAPRSSSPQFSIECCFPRVSSGAGVGDGDVLVL